jgi:hypothetical protein
MQCITSKIAAAMLAVVLAGAAARAQPAASTPAPAGTFLLTIFFKHDQSKTLEQINAQLQAMASTRPFLPPISRW